MNKFIFIIVFPFLFIGCNDSSRVFTPHKDYKNIEWSNAEKEQNIAIKHLFRNEYSSNHLIRLKNQEPPHYHDKHNLMIMIISGKTILHFSDHEVHLKQGDVAIIPKGTYHWAENIDSEASVAFATFSPPFGGKDRRLTK